MKNALWRKRGLMASSGSFEKADGNVVHKAGRTKRRRGERGWTMWTDKRRLGNGGGIKIMRDWRLTKGDLPHGRP